MNVKFSTDPELLQFDVIHGFLKDSYWAADISRERLKRAMENSLNIGAYFDGKQVAYARLVTDHATFAYLCDVFVLPEYRGQGISKSMMKFLMEQPGFDELRRIMLATKDADGLYAQFGFVKINERPPFVMALTRPNIYKTHP